MKKYQSYKSTQVEWIGDIPEYWEFLPLKYYYSYTKGKNGQLLTKSFLEELGDGLFPVYSGMTENDGIIGYWNKYEFDFVDKVIFTTTVGAKFMTTKLLTGKFSLSQNCLIMSPKNEKSDPSFIHYFLEYDFLFKKELVPTIIQPSLRMEDLDTFKICLPPISEQRQIVKFLDEKTELIDKLISTKEQKIELLKQKRTSLINEVITKGLNSSIKMKDSEVEWIGEIPKNWRVVPLRFLGSFQNGISKGSESFGHGLPFMNYGDVYKNEVTPIFVEGKVDSTESERVQYSVLRGDIFFTRTSESKDDIGISSTCLTTINQCVFSGFVIRFRFFNTTHIPEYSKYHFQTHWKKVFIESKMNIVTRSSLSQQILGQVPVLIPPINEQIQIVNFLDSKTKEIDDMIQMEQKKIDLIKEYRQSVISEVITGKTDVRTNLN